MTNFFGRKSVAPRLLMVVLTISLLFLSLTFTLSMKQPVQASFPGANGKIAFHSYRDGNYEIYGMNANGSGTVRLTDSPKDDYYAAWSADGKKIAFLSTRDDPNGEIYVMNADGTGVSRVTNNGYVDGNPTWSPDGSRLAFESNRTGNYDVYSINTDGSGESRLTTNQAVDAFPAWSPDGQKILFHTYRDGNWEIYVMNADGSNQTNLTKNSAGDFDPDWSPDGSKIVFDSPRTGYYAIYVMNADGSGQIKLTSSAKTVTDRWPAWSPDGKRILFQTNRDSDWEIYVMNAVDGTMVTRLTTWAAGFNGHPDMQPVQATPQVNSEQSNYVTRNELALYLGVLIVAIVALIFINGRRSNRSVPTPSGVQRAPAPETSKTPIVSTPQGASTKHCIKCGSEINGRAKFCRKCGSTQD